MQNPLGEDWFVCPHCGAELAGHATSCRHCGASDESGWSDSSEADSPEEIWEEESAEYDDFVRREFPEYATDGGRRSSVGWVGWVAILLLVLMVLAWTVRG